MNDKAEIGERAVAELIAQLGRLAYGDGFSGGLTPAQWTALRYFARANRFSRTVSGFAEFHATTRGTASQTVKSLVAQGHLSRTRSEKDGRSARLDPTAKAHAILDDDPFESLVHAVRSLSPRPRTALAATLSRLLRQVAWERARRPFGMCPSCRHLQGDEYCSEGEPPFECGFVGEPLDWSELMQICVNFEPGRNPVTKRLSS